jgi:hypothetical protein
MNTALAESIWAWQTLLGDRVSTIVPVIYDQGAEWRVADAKGKIAPFHAHETIRRYREWEESEIFPIARAINFAYSKKITEIPIDFSSPESVASSRRAWTPLIEHNRRSSAVVARYWRNRWADPRTGDFSPPELQSDGERLIEAECEHRRWLAFQLVENVTFFDQSKFPDSAIDAAISTRKKGGLKLRDVARVHKDLRTFASIKDKSVKDKDQVIVQSIPRILSAVREGASVVSGGSAP